ncbi:hypothetical protein QYM36_009078 [Artemia franciscana]|uniref:Uncharacterized protein n=1 Tax=Artemia franciscana TaxID=6661 RepID=A0AA88HYR1_ARTSF|nr:hypothetical protein QYM36_009078 [Artemia franciscana]
MYHYHKYHYNKIPLNMFVNDKEQEHEEISDIPSDFLDSDPEYIPDEEESDKIKRTRSFSTHLKQEAIESDEDVWESSEEEHVRRPLAREKKKKKKVVTAIDDGDLLQYNRRIADWQASKEHDIKGYEEFEGGFKMPYKIWKQLFA